ncbi:MAG: DUF1987 domain-containing protein [Flavobacteriia bacterium]|nr:DUF1987 domain-containing protein [Flavobacteriia bacterium]
MVDFFREATLQTPLISFKTNGEMEIKGRAIPDNPEPFWSDALVWFDKYSENPCPHTIFRIDLEYFNISSSKRILFLLYKLNEIVEQGLEAKVEWYYRKADEEMYEVGQDYAFMVKVPFDFKEYDHDIAVA